MNNLPSMEMFIHLCEQHGIIYKDKNLKPLKLSKKLGFDVPDTEEACPFRYGAYAASIELLKNLAPFYSFLEHDVPRQRLFQSALAAYGRED